MTPVAAHGPRRIRWLLLGGLLLIAAGLGAAAWWRSRPPVPPEMPTENLEPEVVEAIQDARQDVLVQPLSAYHWGRLGQVLLANQVHEEQSLFCFRRAEHLDPKDARWPYYQAGILLNQGKPEEAIPKLRQAVELCEGRGTPNTAPRLWLAETLVTVGQPDAAEDHFRQVLAAEEQNPRAHLGLALLAYSRRDWQACRAHLEPFVSNLRARKKACAQLATICQRLGDEEGARKYSALAAQFPRDLEWMDPFVTDYMQLSARKRDRYRLVERLEAEGHLAEAASLLWPLIEKHPADYLPRLLLGRILSQMGDYEQGEHHLRKAGELAPDKFQAHYLLSLTLFKKGEALARGGEADRGKAEGIFEESIRCAHQALAINADFGFAHMALGMSLKHLGRRADALAAFRRAVHCNPEYADNHLLLAAALAEEGKVSEARYHLEQAQLLAGPNDPRPKAALEELKGRNSPSAPGP